MNFPYITKIKVNDCYAYQNFEIPISKPNENYKHLIITGKNGSGKTTILNNISNLIHSFIKNNNNFTNYNYKNHANKLFNINGKKQNLEVLFEQNQIAKFDKNFIFSHFSDERIEKYSNVQTLIKDEDITKKINSKKEFSKLFIQYLVNKKAYQAFDYLKNKKESKKTHKVFFKDFIKILKSIFNDKDLKLIFEEEIFEFFIKLSNGQEKFSFNQFSAGYFAYTNIILDLLIKTDLIRKEKQDYNFEPAGIVLIDEPDVHLHLEMQYQILPMLTNLFPKIQFIAATHSPAIISSIKNSVIFDISTKKNVSDEIVGTSYSNLMITHFGLENEFSAIAIEIFNKIDDLYKLKDNEKIIIEMKKIYTENEKYLTPSSRLEIESRIILLQNKLKNL